MRVLDRAKLAAAVPFPTAMAAQYALVAGLLAVAAFTRFWRLDTPDNFYFDEVYHAFTGREFLRGNAAAWEFFATPPQGFAFEWTHPPLAKLFMAGGMLFIGENPLGWRFFGALLGVATVLLVYLLGKRLFKSEVVGLAAAFLLTFEGLSFVQSRVAMNDIYVVFFIVAALYFLVSDRHLLSGIFFGAALATKWSAIWTVFPIAFYFIYKFLQTERARRRSLLVESLLTVPYFFIVIPLFVYFLSYLPFFLTGHDLRDLWDLQRQMYWYHSGLEATHPYQSPWGTWPIMMRTIFYYISPSGDAKIYALGNPIIFWFGVPALAFAGWQGLKRVRIRLDRGTGEVAIAGRLRELDFGVLFVVVAYLSFLLPWALSPRIMFLYHYLPSVPFLALAGGYAIWRLWQRRWGRRGAIALLTAAFLAFVYFYPHLAAVPVPGWLGESYFWFPTWR
ncbi:MAG: phospholipid carrier-dependent glycosyltransferase [Dehalococcoidia bacterium]